MPDVICPKGWALAKLGDLGEVNRGRSRHRPRYADHLYGGPYPFIQTGDIRMSGGRITSHSQTYGEAGLAQSRLWPAGTMCITIAANIAETAILTYPACFPDSVVGFIANRDKADVQFVEYMFRHIKHFIQREASGSVQDNINLATLDRLLFPIPPLPEQRAIAGVLGALDDKIELNRRTSRTLEKLARAIFRAWFVDFEPVKAKAAGARSFPSMPQEAFDALPTRFVESELGPIPEGWEVKPFSDVIALEYGKALKAEIRRPGPVPVYGSNGQVGWHNQALVQDPGIVIGRKGNPGTVNWVSGRFFPIDTTFWVRSLMAEIPSRFLYYSLEFANLPHLSESSAVPGLNRTAALSMLCILPTAPLLEHFVETIREPLRLSESFVGESRTLATLRDYLLPKLLSGEVLVAEAEKMAGEAMS